MKLQAYGIDGQLLQWIGSWLIGRQQRVTIGKYKSVWKAVTSGVAQGSVLGPLLFLIYINDLPDTILHHIKLYADDSKIIGVIETPQDNATLQSDIDTAVSWSHTWLMRFNLDKCKVMHVGKTNHKSTFVYSMKDSTGAQHTLDSTVVERDLGVLVSDDLKVKNQVDSSAAIANRMFGKLKKAFRGRGSFLWRVLYTTYIRPHLEFAIQAEYGLHI